MRGNRLWVIVAAVTVVVLAVAGGGAYYLLRTEGDPATTARAFLGAWQRGDLAAMRAQVAAPPADFDQDYAALKSGLGVTKVAATPGAVAHHGHRARVPFTAALTLPSGAWRYTGRLDLVVAHRTWKIDWSPEAIHPDLHAGQHLTTAFRWPARAHVLAADGSAVDGPAAGGSVQMMVGSTGTLTAKEATRLGTPYQKGDVVGRSGIQQRFDKRLAGTPATAISVADASGHPLKAVGGFPATPGKNVRTSLDPHVEQAAAAAVQGQTKPTSLVAIRPETGSVLAVANLPGGFDRALQGTYPPGSTFKVVTAYALLEAGLQPSSMVDCPEATNIGGQMIHNSEGEGGGAMTFKTALAQSCNTAFAEQTHKLLSPAKLNAAASLFGFDQRLDPGVTAAAGSFPTPTSDAEMAVSAFGQGRDLANALDMATVSAGVASGTWRPPVLVTEPQVPQKARPGRLDPVARAKLDDMMRAVVTSGTAKPAGLPPGTAGKTGTAEYGSAVDGKGPRTHALFMGYRNDVAFAVIVEDGGFGAKAAAPIAARFLNGL